MFFYLSRWGNARHFHLSLGIFLLCHFLGACFSGPKVVLAPVSLDVRQMQTRVYEMSDELSLLSAGVAVLQDMGFAVDESETKLGIVTASKTVDANKMGQFATSMTAFLLSTNGSRSRLIRSKR